MRLNFNDIWKEKSISKTNFREWLSKTNYKLNIKLPRMIILETDLRPRLGWAAQAGRP